MDAQTWYRLLAHLASQGQFSSLLNGFVTKKDGHLHFALSDSHNDEQSAQLKQVIKALLDDPDTAGQLQKLIESGSGAESFPHVVAIIVNARVSPTEAQHDAEPRTLREAIDREWPW